MVRAFPPIPVAGCIWLRSGSRNISWARSKHGAAEPFYEKLALDLIGARKPQAVSEIAFAGLNMIQAAFAGFCPAAGVFKTFGVKPGAAFRWTPDERACGGPAAWLCDWRWTQSYTYFSPRRPNPRTSSYVTVRSRLCTPFLCSAGRDS